MPSHDVIIIGQGYAGLKAASLAVARGLRVATVESFFPGGLVMSINHLDPAPAGESACGPDLTGGLSMDVMDGGALNANGEIEAITLLPDGNWAVEVGGEAMTSPKLVIATGATLRKLGVPGEVDYEGRGVSACADCDGPLYHGKEAVIVGGGDSAFQEAMALALYVEKVTIVMRAYAPRARADLVAAVAADPKVEVVAGANVEEIVGDAAGVTGVRLSDGRTIDCAAVFPFIGLVPATASLPVDLEHDAAGGVVTSAGLATDLPGVFAIGAVRSGFGGLLSDAAEDAALVIGQL